MQSLRQTSTRVFRHLLASQPTTAAKIAFAWQIAAGQTLARAVSATWDGENGLRVDARDPHWAREIRHARPIILERMSQLLGEGVVTAISVRGPHA